MSLNGLNDEAVTTAHSSTLAQVDGWFLLKYASRDAVELLSSGSCGINEARAAVLKYNKKSPLCGVLHFRERTVLLKYVPNGTSRVEQVRSAVHFAEFEKFTQSDVVFSFSDPQELSAHSLLAKDALPGCPVSASTSPTGSEKNLNEPDEDGEGGCAGLEGTETAVGSAAKVETAPDAASMRSRPFSPTEYNNSRPCTPKSLGGGGGSGGVAAIASPNSYAQSVRSMRSLNPSRRPVSQIARSNTDFSYLYKPKVKLGPRPTQEPQPHPAESKSVKLPASLKAAVRNRGSSSRPKSRDSSTTPSTGALSTPPVPTISKMSAVSHASQISVPGRRSVSSPAASPGMTPEKRRLMRAVELRKKQKAAQLAQQGLNDTLTHGEEKADVAAERQAAPADGDDTITPRRDEATCYTDVGPVLTPCECSATPEHIKDDCGVLLTGGETGNAVARPPTPIASSPISVQDSSDPTSTAPSSISDGNERRDGLVVEDRPILTATKSHSERATEILLGVSSAAFAVLVPDWDVSSSPVRGATGDEQAAAAARAESSPDITGNPPPPSSALLFTQSCKRGSLVDSAGVSSDAESSDHGCQYLSDDDSLMDELQSATVEEAKSMSVSKPPIMPIRPGQIPQASARPAKLIENFVDSNPLSMNRTISPTQLSPSPDGQFRMGPRSLSASHANSMLHTAPLLKTTNVSSGISQRIKALAERSTSVDGPPQATLKVNHPPNGDHISIAQRSSSFRSSSTRNNGLKPVSKASFISVPPLERPMSRGNNSTGDGVHTVYNKNAANKAESVTVTTRIVQRPQTPCADSEASPLRLRDCPVAPDVAVVTPSIESPTVSEQSSLPLTSDDLSSTQTPVAPAEHPVQTLYPSLPNSGWASPSHTIGDASSSPQIPCSQSMASLDILGTEEAEDKKKGNRASRLLKRMSNSLTTSKRSLNQMMNSAAQEEPSKPILEKEPQSGVEIGDLNVQFPDTPVWKRKWVEIDVQGNIVLAETKQQSKGTPKRYHLSEFSDVLAPDQEREEMPNSVMLDFRDGRTLQCACEDSKGQSRVLGILRTAHAPWAH